MRQQTKSILDLRCFGHVAEAKDLPQPTLLTLDIS